MPCPLSTGEPPPTTITSRTASTMTLPDAIGDNCAPNTLARALLPAIVRANAATLESIVGDARALTAAPVAAALLAAAATCSHLRRFGDDSARVHADDLPAEAAAVLAACPRLCLGGDLKRLERSASSPPRSAFASSA